MRRRCADAWTFAQQPEGRLVLAWIALVAFVALATVGCSARSCRRVSSTWLHVRFDDGQPPVYTMTPTTFVVCRPMFGWK